MSNDFFNAIIEDIADVTMNDPNQMSLPWDDIDEMDNLKMHLEEDTPPDFSDLD